jgi:hypothetical protein
VGAAAGRHGCTAALRALVTPLKTMEKTMMTPDTTDSVSWLQKPSHEARFSRRAHVATLAATVARCAASSADSGLPPGDAADAAAARGGSGARSGARRGAGASSGAARRTLALPTRGAAGAAARCVRRGAAHAPARGAHSGAARSVSMTRACTSKTARDRRGARGARD